MKNEKDVNVVENAYALKKKQITHEQLCAFFEYFLNTIKANFKNVDYIINNNSANGRVFLVDNDNDNDGVNAKKIMEQIDKFCSESFMGALNLYIIDNFEISHPRQYNRNLLLSKTINGKVLQLSIVR